MNISAGFMLSLATLLVVVAGEPSWARETEITPTQNFGDPAPPIAPQSALAVSRIHLHACRVADVDETLECGVYEVPENRSARGGRRLRLDIIVIPAIAEKFSNVPIFYFSGGPGEAATQAAADFVHSWERRSQDVVLIDVRGSAKRGGLDCGFGGSDDNLQDYLEPMFADGSRYRSCRRELERRADLTQYTTSAFVADIDEIREAMGYDKIDIEAGSYGTRLAISYLHYHDAHVHSAFLGGILAMENRSPLYHAAAAQQSFEHLVEECVAEPACHAAYPDPNGDLAAILERLHKAPVSVGIAHPVTGKPVRISLSASAFGDGLRVMLYFVKQGRRVPMLLQRARAGDFGPFAQAALKSSRSIKNDIRSGLLLSVACPEDVARIRPEEVALEARASFIGDYRVRGEIAACATWPSTKMPPGYFDAFQSTVPVVLFSGKLDPVTPPPWGELVKRLFPNSVHLVFPSSHVEMDDCIGSIGAQLFRTGSVQGLDTRCVAEQKNPPFVLPGS